MARLLAWLVVLSACSAELPPGGEWLPAEEALLPVDIVAPREPTPTGEVVRVVTFNLERGGNVAGIVAAIRNHADLAAADVILAQEIEDYADEGDTRAARIAEGLGWGHVYARARSEKGGFQGLAVFSPHALSAVRVMALPYADLRVFSVPRIALGVDLETPRGTLHLISVHLDTRMNIAERVLQLRPAVREEPPGTVVAGDFNMNPWVWAGSLIPVWTLDAAVETDQAPLLDDFMRRIGYTTPTEDVGPTEHLAGFDLRLDAIYLKGVEASSEPVVERGITVSDHYPMWMDVRLP